MTDRRFIFLNSKYKKKHQITKFETNTQMWRESSKLDFRKAAATAIESCNKYPTMTITRGVVAQWYGAGFVIGRSRVRPPIYVLPRNNLGQVVYMHVPLSTKQYKLVPASAGT